MEEWKADEKNHCVFCKTDAAGVQAEKTGLGMLENNTIPGFLPFTYYYVDDSICFRYDSKDLQSVSAYFAKKNADASDIRFLCSEPLRIIRRGSEYLLSENGYGLDPSFLYWDRFQKELALCYLPGKKQSAREEYVHFLEYLMEHTDHGDKKAVSLIYGVYDLAASQGVHTDAILSFLSEEPADDLPRLSPVLEQTVGRVQQKIMEVSGTLCPSEKRSEYIVGRESGCDIVLPFAAVEEKHAVIGGGKDGFSVTNLSAKGGTCLNGKPLPVKKKTPCKKNDVLSFAGISYRME